MLVSPVNMQGYFFLGDCHILGCFTCQLTVVPVHGILHCDIYMAYITPRFILFLVLLV